MRLISIVGPTAVGKTAYAIRMALELGAPVISADSRQLFRGMNIGTAKPTLEEMLGVPHYLIDWVNPDEEVSAGRFALEVQRLLQGPISKHEVVILAGGSGLYLDAVWNGLDDLPEVPASVRAQVQSWLTGEGLPALVERLHRLDAAAPELIACDNPRRVARALELVLVSGQPLASLWGRKKIIVSGVSHEKIGIQLPRQELNQRIDLRVEHMFALGLVSEVAGLIQMYPTTLNAFRTVGYDEVIRHLGGEYDLQTCISLVKTHTRQYAKRQMTWFRRYADIRWIEPELQ